VGAFYERGTPAGFGTSGVYGSGLRPETVARPLPCERSTLLVARNPDMWRETPAPVSRACQRLACQLLPRKLTFLEQIWSRYTQMLGAVKDS